MIMEFGDFAGRNVCSVSDRQKFGTMIYGTQRDLSLARIFTHWEILPYLSRLRAGERLCTHAYGYVYLIETKSLQSKLIRISLNPCSNFVDHR